MHKLIYSLSGALALTLTGCGGGGGGSSSAGNAMVSPAAAAAAATAAVASLAPILPGQASSIGPGAGISQAIAGHYDRLNQVRMAMGLPGLDWNDALSTSAQRHADYQQINQQLDHSEAVGKPGFSGESYGGRDSAAGYSGSLESEVIIGGAPATAADGRNLMDAMLTAPGHRFVLLAYEFSEVGMGAAPLTTELGTRVTRKVPADGILPYPYDGQSNVPTTYSPASEMPNPLPGVSTTGFPLSLHTSMFGNFTVSKVSLVNMATGLEQPVLRTDTAGAALSAFVVFPRDPLAPNTAYCLSVELSISGKTRQVKTGFTTASY